MGTMVKKYTRLRRLTRVWVDHPVYFVTTCLKNRRPLLDHPQTARVLIEEWKTCGNRYGWTVGSYVIMPDHVHFFCSHSREARGLSRFVGKWKEWTSKSLSKLPSHRSIAWQRGFFDHLLRSSDS